MRSLSRRLLEKLVADRPCHALELSCGRLGVSSVRLRLPATSPLYQSDGGEFIELPADGVLSRSVLTRGDYQPETLEFFRAHGSDGACALLDLGANVGLVTRQLLHGLPQIAAAVCFEPHPGHFALLARNLAHLPQCHAVQAAVGTSDAEMHFYEELRNAGNYSLNSDAMRGREHRTSTVRCISASEARLLAPLPEAARGLPLLWKSDTQGFDEAIMTCLPNGFWSRVIAGVMEIWRIERPAFDRQRLNEVLAEFPVRRFGDELGRNVPVAEILEFSAGNDYGHRDLFFARADAAHGRIGRPASSPLATSHYPA
jgi:FkbM family methyltransferase